MEQMDIATLQRDIEKQLSKKFVDAILCNQYSWWLLENITDKKKEQLISQQKTVLNKNQLDQLSDWLEKIIKKNMPFAYAIGKVPFLDLELFIEPPTLIPRPETEELCATLIEQLSQLNNQKLTILDIGTGSGCIALSLAKAIPNAQIFAVDIADTALELAARNAKHNNITNASFLNSNVFVNLPSELTFDLIVSNPPYITESEWENLDDSVAQWEDRNALVAQNEGLAIIERIIKQAPQFLHENKEMEQHNIAQLIFEIGYKQGNAVSRLLENGNFTDITVSKDLENKDRFVSGRLSGE